MRVLAVAPHPDDEVIGVGGSIILHSRAGDQVHVVHVIERERGIGDAESADYAAEARKAAKVLGATRCTMLDAASRGGAIDRDTLVNLVRVVRAAAPHVVYVPHADENDAEHEAVFELATEALWIACAPHMPEAGPPMEAFPDLVLGYEVWTPLQRAQYVQDISDVIDDKVEAMECYQSQLRHRAWDKSIRGMAAYRGCMTLSSVAAEAFSVITMRSSMSALRRGLDQTAHA